MNELDEDLLMKAYEGFEEDLSEVPVLEGRLNSGRYKDIEIIGEGGAKEVFHTKDLATGRDLVRVYPRSKEIEDEFLREAFLHAQLEHPNIIPFYDIGIEEGRPFFCMKLIDGETLGSWVKNNLNHINDDDYRSSALDIFIAICNAVEYAHSKDVKHYDLKPENIQISSHGEVLVGDWGLARADYKLDELVNTGIQCSGQFTRHGFLSGTPGYMAPEQCIKGGDKGKQADIYALGALLVFLYTGEAPVTGTMDERMRNTIDGVFSFDATAISPRLLPIVNKALTIKASDRYQEVEHILGDLKAYRAGFLTSVDISSPGLLLKTFYKRYSGRFNVAFATLIVIFLIITFFFYELKKSERIALDAQDNAETALVSLQEAQDAKDRERKAFARHLFTESVKYYERADMNVPNLHYRESIKALEAIDQAIEYDDEDEESWALRGKLLILTDQLAEARKAFLNAGEAYEQWVNVIEAVLDSDPLSGNLQYDPQESKDVVKLLTKLKELGDSQLLEMYIDTKSNDYYMQKNRYLFVRWVTKYRSGNENSLHFIFDGKSKALDISNNPALSDLSHLRFLEIKRLNLSKTAVEDADLNIIRNKSISVLNLAHTKVTNLAMIAVSSLAIKTLDISYTKVSNITPLESTPIEHLNITGCKMKNIRLFTKLRFLKSIRCSAQEVGKLKTIFVNRPNVSILAEKIE